MKMIAFPRPPSVDRQMEDIRKALSEMHRTLYKWHRAAENATERMHFPLEEIDTALNGIRNEVTNIRNSFIDVIGKFPSQFVWLSFLLLLDLLIWTFAIFLIIKIVEGMREIGRRGRILREGENAREFVEEGRRTKKDTEKPIGKCHVEESVGDEFGFCPLSSLRHFPEMLLSSQTMELPQGILKSAPKNNFQMEPIKTMRTTKRNSTTETAKFGGKEKEMQTALLSKESLYLSENLN